MVTIDYDTAHNVVEKNKNLHWWDGWNILEFKKDIKAEMSERGLRINGEWGFYKIYEPGQDGWKVPQKYVR